MALKHERKGKDSNCPEEDVCEQFVHQQVIEDYVI